MTAIVSDKLRIYNAQRFAIDAAADNNVYAFIGKPTPWANELLPDLPEDTTEQRDLNYWKDALGFQKIAGVSACIPRYNWTTGTVYAQYDSNDSELFRKAFFVLSTDVATGRLYVYKCLSNNRGATSTVNPVTVTTANARPFTTADNYVWILMYEIQASDQENFSTPQFIPVRRLTVSDGSVQAQVQAAALFGGIFAINVTAVGSGYTVPPAVTITGDGTGATAQAFVSGGQVIRVAMTAVGSATPLPPSLLALLELVQLPKLASLLKVVMARMPRSSFLAISPRLLLLSRQTMEALSVSTMTSVALAWFVRHSSLEAPPLPPELLSVRLIGFV